MMSLLRSALFMVLVIPYTIFVALQILCSFWLPPHRRLGLVRPWVRITSWLIEHLLGIHCKMIGLDNIPAGPVVVLAKHQSAWETIVLQLPFPEPVFVWKQELRKLPFFGWALATLPGICIDRSAGQDALRQLVEQGSERLAEGYSVIVFPEGTRVAPGMAACDVAYLGQRFQIEGDPTGRTYLCADTGSAVHGLHRDIWFMSNRDGWHWQQSVGRHAFIRVLP